ncbi:hypothetical protein [Paenibacillus alvei]|uniref:Uncharacterized protein n=1 Tax=Paenibacillus alvei TaxID=44250 RepID=A0A383RCA9_PAEAL|nr:hypothetical protein [Paenibacillus alvei]SYX84638.1 protein of unknown function [Paenibacillus alvei]
MNKLTDEQLKELRELYRGECKWAADPEHVRTLLQEVERMKEENEVFARLIKQLEWSSYDELGESICPLCGFDKDHGHADSCKLSSAIQRIQEEGKQS